MTISQATAPPPAPFRHEALFYRGDRDFVPSVLPFVTEGLAQGDAVVVALRAERRQQLRQALGDASAAVTFLEMERVGANPARLVAEWESQLVGRRQLVRGVGEPIWSTRSQAEIVEGQRHEALLNLAFENTWGCHIVCPYDTEALSGAVVAEARHNHPFVIEDHRVATSKEYVGLAALSAPFDSPLSEIPADALVLDFGPEDLGAVRAVVADRADQADLCPRHPDEAVLAVHEAAANSVRHGERKGRLSIWTEGRALLCQIDDHGTLLDPLAGRRRPPAMVESGRGMWMVNQLCDLTQVRSSPAGNTVRMHFHPV